MPAPLGAPSRLFPIALSALLLWIPAIAAHAQAMVPAAAPLSATPGVTPAVETILHSRNKVVLEVSGRSASLTMTIRSFSTGRRLQGDVAFALSSDEPLEPTDNLTCAPSLTFACGIVARFPDAREKQDAPSVFEALVQDGMIRLRQEETGPESGERNGGAFEGFVEGLIDNTSVAVRVRVDQKQDFIFDLRRLAWPLAEFGADHPFSLRFAGDPVLAGLKKGFPSRYLKIVDLVRRTVPDSGAISPEAQTAILEAMHAQVGSLRPMVPDALLEAIVTNSVAAARQIGSRNLSLCNALAVAAVSAVTTPELQDTAVAKEEYDLWRQVVEQAKPRFIRRVPNEALLPSTPRFEENMRVANESGCGMFAAVMEAILKLPREERRLWLRATVGF